MPKVSIAVPIYGVEKLIERCAKSLFEQTYNNLEYIFVNDKTPDKSIELLIKTLENYPKRKQQVKIIHHLQNRGLSAARNTAIENANGEFIIHVDSDDYLEFDAIEKLVSMQNKTHADIVTGQAFQHTHNCYYIMERPQFNKKEDFILDMIQPTIHHTIWGRLIKRSLYTNFNIKAKEGINIGEDLQVMSQLSFYSNKFATIPDVIYHYDTTNMESYMNTTASKEKRIYKFTQDFKSMQYIFSFFEEHDSTFLPEILKHMKYFTIKLMKEYCIIDNKLGYISSKNELLKYNIKLHTKEKIFFSNYYISKYLLKIKSLF